MPPFFVQYVQTGPFSLMQQVVWAVVPSGVTHGFNLSGHLRFRHCGQSCLPIALHSRSCCQPCGVWLYGAPQWKDSTVTVYCDNQSTVAIVNSGYSKIPRIMHVLRCLFFIRARFNIDLIALHIPGTSNQLADAISRDHLHVLFAQVPGAQQCLLPNQIVALTLDQQLNWTSPTWRQSFAACFLPV